jgi:hypothetical protein
MGKLLVVVHNFYIDRRSVRPTETNAPTVVNSDAVLTFPVSCECLESIPSNGAKVAERKGGVQIEEALSGRLVKGRKPLDKNIPSRRTETSESCTFNVLLIA